jgi:DNA topoisomerase-1
MAKTAAKPAKSKTTAKAKPKATAKTKASASKTTAKPKPAAKTKAKAKKMSGDSDGGSAKGKSLVIVESPAKAKTIKKILGSAYQIKASVGHIRDLPEKKLGVDIEQNFEPIYEVMAKKADIVEELQHLAAECDMVYLAADPDREGEAIAWHIQELLNKPQDKVCRIEFHEITKNAILEAMKHPRNIDMSRVDAQQARRVLDRLVGYKLSPLLWKKVTKGLSAGRVQSVSVRLICDREEIIKAFVPEEYWTVNVDLSVPNIPQGKLTAELSKVDGQKANIPNQETADKIVQTLNTQPYSVSAVQEKESKRNPVAPHITSSLQRDASTRFGYPVKKTMQIAQKLYEGMDLGAEGPVGLITYMRTDSTRVSEEAQTEAREFIARKYGPDYVPPTPREYLKKGKSVQDAHEAIRPTSVERTPESLKDVLNEEQFKIYKLIWSRFVSSQMESARIQTKSAEITSGNCLLRASQSKILFPGYLAVYQSDDEEPAEEGVIPDLKKGDALTKIQVNPKQHFTEPPPRYNEASLVKVMEELGIGRPSTYAPTIATIQDRGYVRKEDKALHPTELGMVVNRLLVEHFKDIVDTNFTAHLESKLDSIADENLKWQGVVREFYEPFEATLKKASNEMEKVLVLIENENCSDCGKPMALKTSRFGSHFLGCTGYPECKGTRPLSKDQKPAPEDRPTEEKCEACKGDMVIRYGPYGDYLACLDQECKAKRPLIIKTNVNCDECDTGEYVQKKSRYGKIFFACNQYPNCKSALWNKPTGTRCPECNSLLVEKVLKKGTFHACSKKECKFIETISLATG